MIADGLSNDTTWPPASWSVYGKQWTSNEDCLVSNIQSPYFVKIRFAAWKLWLF